MTITESQIKESIDKNMDEFRAKALRGKVDGNDVAKLFGFEEMYNEGIEEEDEFQSLKKMVIQEMSKDENVISEAEGDEESENTSEENSETEDSNTDNTEEDSQQDSENEDEESKKENNNDGENGEEPKDDKEKEEDEKGPLKPGETTHLESFEELFNETGTKIKIQKQGIGPEPSPMFGQSSAKHNKYKISLTNDKGGDISWIYWDSEKNTQDNTVPDTETVMKDFALRLESAVVGTSLENFKEQFGYDDIDGSLAQKQYEGVRKMKDNIKKIFPDQHNIYQLIQIAKKS